MRFAAVRRETEVITACGQLLATLGIREGTSVYDPGWVGAEVLRTATLGNFCRASY